MRREKSLLRWFGAISGLLVWVAAGAADPEDYQRARWDPLHFQPAIATAEDEQCLACHREIVLDQVRPAALAGVTAAEALAWYQTLDTYAGEQESFHRRHLATPYANRVMRLKCNSCHQGNAPRDEAPGTHASDDPSLTLRKHVDPNLCLMCHGRFPAQNMGVPGDWREHGKLFNNSCLTCHVAFRTVRHQVNYLKPEAIEDLAKEDNDVCFGCHGGRSWYRISFPYARNAWPGMAPQVPDWAKDRPTQSEARFLAGAAKSQP